MMLFRRTFLALGAAFACATDRRSTPMPPATLDLAALLEQTPRNEVIVRVEEQLERGLRPVDLLAAFQLAATRTISTRADFGPPHHALLCGPAVARIERSLHTRGPLLWAVDFFKSAQAEAQVPGERMPPADRLPSVPGSRAQAEFVAALNEFDGARAESAIVSLHRHAPLRQVVDTLLVHGSKDLRHIGHKALHAAHGCRVSNASAWADAEPVFRSIASTLALHYDEEGHDHDTPWTENQARIRRLPDAWPAGDHSDEAIEALLATLRSASPHDACEQVVAWSRRGVSARCVWDAMLLSGAELMFNNPLSIEALHAVTASNAARFAYEQLQQPPDRRLVFMQNVARVADFHGYVAHRSKPQWSVGSLRIDEFFKRAAGGRRFVYFLLPHELLPLAEG